VYSPEGRQETARGNLAGISEPQVTHFEQEAQEIIKYVDSVRKGKICFYPIYTRLNS